MENLPYCSIYFTLYIAEKQEESSPLFTLQTSFPLRLGISPSNFELRLYIIAAALIVLILARLRFRSLFTVSLPFGFGSAHFCVFPLACRHRVSRETLKFILSHLHLLGRVTHPLTPSVTIRSSVLYILIIFIDIYTASVSAAVSDPIGFEFGVEVFAGEDRAGVGMGAGVGVGVDTVVSESKPAIGSVVI